MEKYVSVAKMIKVERASDQAGHTYPMMMANAGLSLAEEMTLAYSHVRNKSKVLGLVGSGNNGGDGLVAMRHLLELGWSCVAYLTAERDSDPLVKEYEKEGGKMIYLRSDPGYSILLKHLLETDIMLDGLLGTGISLPLRSPVRELLGYLKEFCNQVDDPPRIVAIDCPSGVDCDTGEVADECLPADLTVCMAAVKQGLLKVPAHEYIGELAIGDIGLDPDLPEWTEINQYVLNEVGVVDLIPERPLFGHKGTFGTAVIAGGSIKYPGAPVMAGEAAFRIGAGWVEIAIPKSLHPHLAGSFREATWMPLPDDGEIFTSYSASAFLDGVSKADAILVGPGIGLGDGVSDFVERILSEIEVPLVLDADGLKMVASLDEWASKLPGETVLTPHPGEMAILTMLTIPDIQENRVEIAEKYAKEWQQTVVLKGAFTVIASPGGRTAILPIATPALARAGTGDVLAGMITGLLAQGLKPFEASCAGVWYHAQAGLLAADMVGGTAGVLAGDVIRAIPEVLPY